MAPPKTQQAIERHLRDVGDADTDELAEALGKARHLIYQCITRWRAANAANAPRIRSWRRCIGRPGAGGKPVQIWTMARVRDADMPEPETDADYCRRYRAKLGAVVQAKSRARHGGRPRIAPWLQQLAP